MASTAEGSRSMHLHWRPDVINTAIHISKHCAHGCLKLETTIFIKHTSLDARAIVFPELHDLNGNVEFNFSRS